MDGIVSHARSCSNVPETPYSAPGIFLAKPCTSIMRTPLATVANIIQPP
jgi:hypothetical protein